MQTELAVTVGSLGVLLLLERFLPLSKRPVFDFQFLENLYWFHLNLAIRFLFLGTLISQSGRYASSFVGGMALNLESFPVWIQFLIFFLLFDFVSYSSHRLLHSNSILWHFHKLHHSSTELNVTSAVRHSWIELLYNGFFASLLSSFVTTSETIKLSAFLVVNIACHLQHANLKLILPPFMHKIIVTPLNHRWHHAVESFKSHGQNFGFTFTIWDKLFGTYYVPLMEPGELGLSDKDFPRSVLRRTIYPLDAIIPRKKDHI